MTKEVFCKNNCKTVNVSELVSEIHYADLMIAVIAIYIYTQQHNFTDNHALYTPSLGRCIKMASLHSL